MAVPGAVAMTIVFAFEGQDFDEWDIDRDGIVVDSRPFQASVWRGYRIVNDELHVGDRVLYQHPHKPWPEPATIRYPITEIRRVEVIATVSDKPETP